VSCSVSNVALLSTTESKKVKAFLAYLKSYFSSTGKVDSLDSTPKLPSVSKGTRRHEPEDAVDIFTNVRASSLRFPQLVFVVF
jgi:hypothetical protein